MTFMYTFIRSIQNRRYSISSQYKTSVPAVKLDRFLTRSALSPRTRQAPSLLVFHPSPGGAVAPSPVAGVSPSAARYAYGAFIEQTALECGHSSHIKQNETSDRELTLQDNALAYRDFVWG